MFEIGSSLREARERRSLSYGQVEADTAIRTRYIRALEDEDFHILPGPTYTKGFLRAYAEYLGLDGQPYVDEFNSRHHDPRGAAEHPSIASRPRSQPRQRRRHRRESNIVMIALAAIVAVSFLVVLALRFPPTNTATLPTTTPSTSHGATTASTEASTTTGTVPPHGVGGKPHRFKVVLTLTGSTWIEARRGSPTGPGVVTRTGLDLGGKGFTVDAATDPTVTFSSGVPVYLSLGAPGNVTVTINGHRATLPHIASGARMRIDKRGVHAA